MSIKKLYNPEIFQGSLKTKNYFEGWFYKMESFDSKNVMAVIIGVATGENEKEAHAFIQVNYKGESEFFPFNINDFKYDENTLLVSLCNNVFTDKSIELDLVGEKITVKGELNFNDIVTYPKTLLKPGIMGGFSYLRFMECYHGVVNIRHKIQGDFIINKEKINFSKGTGYIEKDWGTSFPKRYLWLQCGSFENSDASIMLAIADIPFIGLEFKGIIGFLHVNGEHHSIATYNGASIKRMETREEELFLIVKNLHYEFEIKATINGEGGHLKAPIKGNMNRQVKEMLMGKIEVIVTKKGRKIFEAKNKTASIEVCGY